MVVLHEITKIIFLLEIVQLSAGFVRLDTTAKPPENPTKGYLEHVSFVLLTSQHLDHLSPDITSLKISNSNFQRIDKNAFDQFPHLNLLEISNSEIQESLDPQILSRVLGLETVILKHVGLQRVNLTLTNVQKLILADNELEMFDGRAVTGPNVNFLDVSNNKLKYLRGSFTNMSKLSMIDLSRNRIAEIPPVFQNNVRLSKILASTNKIKSTDGLKLPWLKTLDLFENEIEELDTDSFSRMTYLEELVLAFNRIYYIDDAFKDLVELKYLNLAWNQISELPGDLFRNNLYLTKLFLQGNKITSLGKFQNVHPHLTHLDLSHNQLQKIDNDFFLSTPALQVLDLSFNRLKSLGNLLEPLPELKILNLAYNNIQLTGNELSANGHLTRVNLSSNSLEDGLKHFRNNHLLTDLDLSFNGISRFCDGDTVLKDLLRMNLKGNEIENVSCLRDFSSLCEVDFRENPLACGEELDDLVLNLAKSKGAPYKLVPEFQADLLSNQCENLSLNRSVSLWNSVKRQLCPNGEDIDAETVEDSISTEDSVKEPKTESFETEETPRDPQEPRPHGMGFVHLPLGWIKNDEMNKPNPLQRSQSGKDSWGSIDENSELLNGFEDEEIEKRPRFSWYTIALILIGLSLTLTCFNLVVFLYIKLRVWKRAEANPQRKYTVLHNEVYKNTTEPSKVCPADEWPLENETRNKLFAYGKINEILLNFGLNKKDKDSESAKNILINSTRDSQNF